MAQPLTPKETKELNQLSRKAQNTPLEGAEYRRWVKLRDRQISTQDEGGGVNQGRTQYRPGDSAIYIGVEAGSDLERGMRLPTTDTAATTGPASFTYTARRKPLYKVGYLNSKQFARELGDMNEDVIEDFQRALYEVGKLKKFTPGKMDPTTKAVFKELITTANQSGRTWFDVFNETISRGFVESTDEEKITPFQAVLDDPVQLRNTFQNSVREIYGGDLPDDEVNAMVDAFRAQQMAKQQAKYNADLSGATTTVTREMEPGAFAEEQVKAKHPQQVNRVKFTDAFDSILQTFTGGGQ